MKKGIFIIALVLSLHNFCFAGIVSKTISIANDWTGSLAPLTGGKSGYMNISVSGTWVGTVALQRRFQAGDWMNVTEWIENIEKALIDVEPGVQYRIGMSVVTSGAAAVRLSN